jgi:hypothetical protein
VTAKQLRSGDSFERLLPSGRDDIVIELIIVAAVMIGFVLYLRW